MKTSQLYVNLASNFCLFLLFCATYHCIAGLTFERYIAIKREGNKKRLEKNLLTSVLILLVLAMCSPKFYNLYHIIIARYHCQTPPSSWITIIAMCTWLLYCSFTINFLTKKAMNFVKSYDEIRQRKLGKTQTTNLRRLRVTKRMWLVFSIVWLPYGIVNVLQTMIDSTIYEHLNAVTRGITFTSFTVLPWVYYHMDKNYAEYIDRKCIEFRNIFPCWKSRVTQLANCRMTNTMSQQTSNIVVSTMSTNAIQYIKQYPKQYPLSTQYPTQVE